MIRDLRFDEIERADKRRRLTRLVVGCVALSAGITFLAARELKIRKDYDDLPAAAMGDLASLQERHNGIEQMLSKHHLWTGAFAARTELDDLMVSIHAEETVLAKAEAERSQELQRITEEIEAARVRGYVFAERREFDLALVQLKRSLELAESIGTDAFQGKPWEYKDKVVTDIHEIEGLLATTGK